MTTGTTQSPIAPQFEALRQRITDQRTKAEAATILREELEAKARELARVFRENFDPTPMACRQLPARPAHRPEASLRRGSRKLVTAEAGGR